MAFTSKPEKPDASVEQNPAKTQRPVNYAIAQKIKSHREFRKITQETMAEMLLMSQQAYSRLETGETDLTITRLHQIADVLRIKSDDLLNLENQYVKALMLPIFDVREYKNNIEFEAYITTIKRQEKLIENLQTELMTTKTEKAALLDLLEDFKGQLTGWADKINLSYSF
jgi:transcriptional regulator with XRE-family HTH domain